MNPFATHSSSRYTPGAAYAALVIALTISLGIAGCKSKPPAPDDASLTAALQARISSDQALTSEPIQFSLQNGVATLNGNVSSDAARALAANDAAQVAGIRTVINNLTVQPAQVAASMPAPASATTPEPVTPAHTPTTRKPSAAYQRPQQASNEVPPPGMNSAPVERSAPPQQAPPPPPAPAFRDITIPSGSTLPVRITQTLDSATTQQGDSFTGTIATDVVIDGLVALRQGTPVTGRVDAVQEAAHFKGSSLLSIELTNINRKGERIPVTTDTFSKAGAGRGKNTAEKVGGGAAVGAILGGIFGGGKGAAIGAAAGGGAGAGAQAITKGQQVQIPSETLIRFRLTNAIALRVSTNDAQSSDSNQQRRPLQPQDQ